MNEFQVFDWNAIGARIRAKKVFIYCFIPVCFICIWALTYSIPTYYTCETSLAAEKVESAEPYRSFTLNRPEQFDLSLSPFRYSIEPDDYVEIVQSTEYLCRVLNTPVMTADSSFSGTYYAYLATQYNYPWYKLVLRFLLRQKQPKAGDPLPGLDPFYPRGVAKEALTLARKSIKCDVDRRTALTKFKIRAQDKLVAALVAQAAADNLQQLTAEFYIDKSENLYRQLQEQIAVTYADYEQAQRLGDSQRAAMLLDAYHAFERQSIILGAQIRYEKMFTTLRNASVPSNPGGPHHLLTAGIATVLLTLLALLIVCWRELFGLSN